MDWQVAFGTVNVIALVAWIALIALPRWPALLSAVLFFGVGLLCLAYVLGLAAVLTGLVSSEGGADFSSIDGVRSIFASDAGVVVGWTHYLAFDLFVGLWIARDADSKNASRLLQAPILLATFLAGPLGLIVWLVVREPAARRQGYRR